MLHFLFDTTNLSPSSLKFPTIFVKEDLIGGSDDLAHLNEAGTLRGLLEGADVKFN
jgi:glutaredoxin-related protein